VFILFEINDATVHDTPIVSPQQLDCFVLLICSLRNTHHSLHLHPLPDDCANAKIKQFLTADSDIIVLSSFLDSKSI
jgi:hypothetical protein